MGVSKTQGIVIKHTNLGEADKILTILTRNKGKIKAIAKGCRKPRSSLLSSSEIFTFSEFVMYKGKSFYHISSAETRETFYNIRKDLLKLSYATFFLELGDYVTDEDIQSERLFLLLAKTLYYLSTDYISVGIISLAFQLKVMSLSGFRPHLENCVHCGKKKDNIERFSISLGGILCQECLACDAKAYKIVQSAIEILKILLNTEISRLNSIKIDNTIFNQLDRIIKDFVANHLEKQFKSLEFLDEIKNHIT